MKKNLLILAAGILVIIAGIIILSYPEDKKEKKKLMFYCAAGVRNPVLELTQKFYEDYGIKCELQYGGSNTLLSNIAVSQKGDLYLAADISYLLQAKERGLVEEILPIAMMKPVIAVRKGNPKKIKSVDDLLKDDVRVALGNPEAASIGKQTKKYLHKVGKWDALKKHVEENGVFKPTVPEVANDLKLGSVDAGIIWDATVNQYSELEMLEIPAFKNAVKEISVGILKSSKHPTEALAVARFLNSEIAVPVFKKFGYKPITGDKWVLNPEINFFCGAVNRRAVEDVLVEFGKREGVTINTIYQGCGILTGQMKAIKSGEGGGGFPDIYMACDNYYLENVHTWFDDGVEVSEADIVIVVPKGNPKNIKTLEDLTRPGMKISVGQPRQCTIGALTRIMLEKMGIYERVMKNVVSQTASSAMLIPSVTTESVDATIAYVTDAQAEKKRIEYIHINNPSAKAVQPVAVSVASDYKVLASRLKQKIIHAEESFKKAGFTFLQNETKMKKEDDGKKK